MANILKIFKNNNKLRADQVYYNSTTSLLDAMWPIGRGFIDFTNTDYSNWLGFRWERELVGLTPVGYKAGDSDFGAIGKTGGEKTHQLNVYEIPAHAHQAVVDVTDIGINNGGSLSGVACSYSWNTIGSYIRTKEVGGNQPHNNLQPYKVVAYWKRVS